MKWRRTPGGLGVMAHDTHGNEYVVGIIGPNHPVNFNGRTVAHVKSTGAGKKMAHKIAARGGVVHVRSKRRSSRFGNAGMSRMHFRAIAENLGSISNPRRRREETDRWVAMASKQNPRFSEDKFRAAVEEAARQASFSRPVRDSRTRFGNRGGRWKRTSARARSERSFRGGKHRTRAFERAYESRPSYMEEASQQEYYSRWHKGRRAQLKKRRVARAKYGNDGAPVTTAPAPTPAAPAASYRRGRRHGRRNARTGRFTRGR